MTRRIDLLAAVVAVGLINVPHSRAQSPATRPAFDVASIKPNISGVDSERIGPILMGRFSANNIAVDLLIRLGI
jgi:hypothetical protein